MMGKSKIALAATGGAIGVAALAAAFFAWSAVSDRSAAIEGDDENDGLDSVLDRYRRLSSAQIYPSAESVKAIEEEKTAVADWRSASLRIASAGDRPAKVSTKGTFKEDVLRDADRIKSLPGSAPGGRFATADFAFGPFKDYISGGKVPDEKDLPVLQRRWDDISFVAETLQECGAAELSDVSYKAEEKKDAAREEKPAAGRRRGRAKPRKPAKGKDAAEKDAPPSAAFTYVFSFKARPAAFVKIVNRFATCERFVSVDDFSFARQRDAVGEALAGEDRDGASAKRQAQDAGSRRRRRGGAAPAAAAKQKDDGPAGSGIVTDPAADNPLAVTMTVTVHDFRSLEEQPAAAATEEKGK